MPNKFASNPLAADPRPARLESASSVWHIVTGEYPPQSGGVSDYSRQVARALVREGDQVHVWCPEGTAFAEEAEPGITVRRTRAHFKVRDLLCLNRWLDHFQGPCKLLIQWVPHGFGYRSMNVFFCLWLWYRSKVRKDEVQIMVHEPFLPFGRSFRQTAAALVHRFMTVMILNSATRIWISIPEWENRLRPYAFGRQLKMDWLPVPSNVVVVPEDNSVPEDTMEFGVAAGQVVLGHFGTFAPVITDMLEPLIERLVADPKRSILLIGRGSLEFIERLVSRAPRLAGRVHATGEISPEQVSRCIRKCDLMLQPFPDGMSSRRTSAMAALCHAKALVTNQGPLSGKIWRDCDAVATVDWSDPAAVTKTVEDLIESEKKRIDLGIRGLHFYREHFDLKHTIKALRLAQQGH